jgi:hypothetical protein
MKLKISFIVSAAMLVVSALTMGISIAPQPSEGAKGQYFLLVSGRTTKPSSWCLKLKTIA